LGTIAKIDGDNTGKNMIYDAVVQGLRPAVRAHVLQSCADNLETLLKAARVAEVAEVPATTQEPVLNQLLTAIQESRQVAEQNQEELRRVTRRVEGLTVAQVSDRQTWPTSAPTTTQTTTTEQTGEQPYRPYRGRGRGRGNRQPAYGREQPNYQGSASTWGQTYQQPQGQGQYQRPYGQNTSTPVSNICHRCGRNHGNQPCWALSVNCRGCGRRGHFQICCMHAQRALQPPTNHQFSQ
jgi:uncharacterized coiled-coil protein SlyX